MIIGLDMDNTIADWLGEFLQRVKKQFNINVPREAITYTRVEEIVIDKFLGKQKAKELGFDTYGSLYDYICSPGFYTLLKPLPGVKEFFTTIKQLGHSILIITKPTGYKNCPYEKVQWLDDMKLEHDGIIMTSHFSHKKLIKVDVIIDDDPRTMSGFTHAYRIMPKYTYNETFIKENPNIITINNMYEAIDHIKNISSINI